MCRISFDLYGAALARADEDAVSRATTRIDPATVTNIIAMAAPAGGHGAPICWYWRTDADGVATLGPTSRPSAQWTRPGATPVAEPGVPDVTAAGR